MNDALAALFDEYWEYQLEQYPSFALSLGDHRYDTEHERFDRDSEDANIARLRGFASRVQEIAPDELTDQERISCEVLTFEATTSVALAETRLAEFDVSHTVGPQTWLPVMIGEFPIIEPAHAEAMLDKYRGIGTAWRDRAERLSEGVVSGRTPMASTAAKTATQIENMTAGDVSDDPLVTSLRLPETWTDVEIADFRERLGGIMVSDVRPGLTAYRDVIVDEVLPVSRPDETPGLCFLADGEETYSRAIHRYTTVAMDPREIHEVGRYQIARLDEEYRKLGGEVLGTTDLEAIYSQLRDDPELHFTDGPSIVAAAEGAMAKARDAMGDWFGRLPKADCVIEEVPAGAEAFYSGPALDGSRPGTFYINTADPSRWSTYEIEALAYHEAIPGHHLQIAIARELEDLPDFLKHASVTAFAEGWGLYTERLADEMGLYAGPLERIGMLALDSMRAGRLVVDTGIHALGWTRQKAIDFLAENSPMAMAAIENEIDRYIALPGQALAYMIGRLEILRIRSEARETLGDAFDIKGFHDVVLGSGLVPLDTLDGMVRRWATTG